MKLRCVLVASLITLVLLSGCTYGGAFASAHQTNVEISESNFSIVATDVSGEASSSHLLGASFSTGFYTESVGLIRLGGTGLLYQEALSDLWKNVEKKIGKIEGKSLALTNVRYDADCTNFFLFTSAKVVVRADVIEF